MKQFIFPNGLQLFALVNPIISEPRLQKQMRDFLMIPILDSKQTNRTLLMNNVINCCKSNGVGWETVPKSNASLKNEARKSFHVSKINYCICCCSCADCIRNWTITWFTSAGPCHLLSTTALQFRVSVLENAHTHTQIHTGIHSHVACHSTSLGESRGEYGGRTDMDDVGTEQTTLWFHSSDTLINRNVFAQELEQ